MANAGDLNKGSFVRYNNELCQVMEYQHRTPGNLRAFYQVKFRNVRNGKLIEQRFRPDETIEIVRVEHHDMQYLYKDGNSLVLMNPETFDQIYVLEEIVGSTVKFLKEEMILKVAFESDSVIGVEPPNFGIYEVSYTEPGVKGDTATNTLKPATLDTGAIVMVPLFVNQGEKIKVDLRTESYVERVK